MSLVKTEAAVLLINIASVFLWQIIRFKINSERISILASCREHVATVVEREGLLARPSNSFLHQSSGGGPLLGMITFSSVSKEQEKLYTVNLSLRLLPLRWWRVHMHPQKPKLSCFSGKVKAFCYVKQFKCKIRKMWRKICTKCRQSQSFKKEKNGFEMLYINYRWENVLNRRYWASNREWEITCPRGEMRGDQPSWDAERYLMEDREMINPYRGQRDDHPSCRRERYLPSGALQ